MNQIDTDEIYKLNCLIEETTPSDSSIDLSIKEDMNNIFISLRVRSKSFCFETNQEGVDFKYLILKVKNEYLKSIINWRKERFL